MLEIFSEDQMPPFVVSYNQFSVPVVGNESSKEEDVIKQLRIDLYKAQAEVGGLEAEVSLLRERHEKEIEIINSSYLKKESLEEEMWRKKEQVLLQERDYLVQSHTAKIKEMQMEKDSMMKAYEAKVSAVKFEMADALQRSKDLYMTVIERMKTEHQNAVDRLTELKSIEVNAAVSAAGRAKEVESVLSHLETNTADLSHITNIVNEKHNSALELTKRGLEMKEKQLKEMEANLGVLKAESESERNRLTVLVNRLESSLSSQGTEVESQKWVLAQEKMKLDSEKGSLVEEKKHFQLLMQNEHKELARIKESLFTEQKEMMRTIAKQKLRIYEVENSNQKITKAPLNEFEVLQLREDKKILEEKIRSLRIQQEEMIEEGRHLEERKLQLEDEYLKNSSLKELLERRTEELEAFERDLESREEKLKESQKSLQKKLSEITQATQNLHLQQKTAMEERARLEFQQEEMTKRYGNRGLCLSCSSRLGGRSVSPGYRLPSDGSERFVRTPEEKIHEDKRYDPASVMNRLKAAREEENKMRLRKELVSTEENVGHISMRSLHS